jgi:glycosyltransferase involved in cell wall biosynthesis
VSLFNKLGKIFKRIFKFRLRAQSLFYHKYYDLNGLKNLVNNDRFICLDRNQKFKILRSIALREWESDNKKLSIDVASEALEIIPNANFAKWIAFRLYDIGFLNKPIALLDKYKSVLTLSPREKVRYSDIIEHKNILNKLPSVPDTVNPSKSSNRKVLLYVTASCLPYHTSGYTTRTHELLLALKASGKTFVILTRPGYPYDRKDSLGSPCNDITKYDGLDYHHIQTPSSKIKLSSYFNEAASKIERFAESHQVNSVHAASNYVNALPALLAARNLGLNFNYEIRGLWDMTRATKVEGYENSERYNVGMSLEYLVARRADRVLCISKSLRTHLVNNNVIKSNIALLPNCVNESTFKKIRDSNIIKHHEFTIGYAGTLNEYEGLDVLVQAIHLMKCKGVFINAKIIGTGPHYPLLYKLVDKLTLTKQIKFIGKLDPLTARKKLSKVHLTVIPRKPYNVCKTVPPIKVIEAIALRLPVVISNLPALRDEIQYCNQSCIFEPYESQALANTIEKYYYNFKSGNITNGHNIDNCNISLNRYWHNYIELLA